MSKNVWGKLEPDKKADILHSMVKLHFERAMKYVPQTPADSVKNVEALFKKVLDGTTIPAGNPVSH